MEHSIAKWEYRDPTYSWKEEERVKASVKILFWVLIGAALVTLLHFSVSAKIPITHAQVDDASICSEALMFFVSGETEVVDYCVDLAARKL